MKTRYFAYVIFVILALISCSEKIDINVKNMDRTYLTVEGFLTDTPFLQQTITLSESTGYFDNEPAPAVRGALVSVDDGLESVVYEETEPGVYAGPRGFHGTPGKTYHLKIEAEVGGENRRYEAVSTMPKSGFQVDSIDYAYSGVMGIDSTWTIAMWGKDAPEPGYFYAFMSVNGHPYPYDLSVVMDDKYFAGQRITAFPIGVMMQTAHNQEVYGPCCKFLEKGDILTFTALTLPKDCFDFFFSFAMNMTGSAIPLFSSQPANCPTNVTGGDAMGYFAACPVSMASVVVDDPLRPVFRYQQALLPGFSGGMPVQTLSKACVILP